MKKNRKKINYIILLIIVAIISFISGSITTESSLNKKIASLNKEILYLKDTINELKEENKKLQSIQESKKDLYSLASEILDYKIALKEENKTIKKEQKKEEKNISQKTFSHKPKLVIIIDDVAFKWETNLIKSIPFHITPSFFPPTSRHPNTPILAKNFKHYMVHTPMEAKNYPKPEENTLTTNDSYEVIYARLNQIKKFFPNVKFINNHTGSTFTSNQESMLKLFKAMQELNISFVDSRTTPLSKAEYANKFFKLNYLFSRDIFIDNYQNRDYIRKQLQKAVNIAKKRGYAIAIGHPHKITLQTIANSDDILKNVKVVYIDEITNNE